MIFQTDLNAQRNASYESSITNLEKAQRLLDERFKNKQISNDEYIRQSNELKKKIEQCKGTIGRDF